MRKNLLFSLLQIVTSLAVGAGLMLFFFSPTTNEGDQSTQGPELCAQQFPLTDKRLSCAEYAESRDNMQALSAKLTHIAQSHVSEKKAVRVSVWVRDLITRQWAAYNEHDQYIPASLLKVPLMITYYKIAEVEPSILDQRLTYAEPEQPDKPGIPPAQTLTRGQSYTVAELIEQMIIYSDNNTMRLLLNHIGDQILFKTLTDLGLQVVTASDTVNFVTVKTYANVFRILYNASYLNREYSEKALELLTRTKFKGVTKSLPSSAVVAHKFGEREVADPEGNVMTVQLHDCGIVYKGEKSYSLCIMTEGKDLKVQETILEDISKLVYDTM